MIVLTMMTIATMIIDINRWMVVLLLMFNFLVDLLLSRQINIRESLRAKLRS